MSRLNSPAVLLVLTALALAPATAPAAPAPYSLPWQLRPAQPVSVVRLDTSVANYRPPGAATDTLTTAAMLLASYKLTPAFAAMARVGVVRNEPGSGDAQTALINPVLGGTYGVTLSPSLRLALYLGVALPVGMGGGNGADPGLAAAAKAGILTRSAMDNAMFAVNDLTFFPGVDLAFVQGGFTAQVEATVLQLTRVRGEDTQADASRTNLTTGLHLGYFLAPWVSVGGELRYQRWLSTPVSVAADGALRDNITVAAGPRFHVKLSDRLTARPGISYTTGLDAPMRSQRFQIFQLDLPVVF